MMKKPWKNTYKMHDACSLKSKLSCNHSWFILFFKRRNSAKKWKQKYNNPSSNLNTWIQVQTMKFWISEDCSTKNPKIHLFKQNPLDSGPKILFEKMDFWIFGQPARPRMSSALGHKMHFCLEYIAENFAHSGFAGDYF